MSAVPAWTQLIVAVGALLGAVTVLARLLLKHFPPRSVSLAAEVAAAKTELADARAAFTAEVAEVRREVASCRAELRLLTDYAHDLREHIALEKDPPPPDWPEGLRL